jgi:uncharacterized protein YdaU (DUF1376 family)
MGLSLNSAELLQSIAAGEKVAIPTALDGQKLPYMPVYVSNILGSADVTAMTETQFSRYMRLLLRAWDSETPGFLPADPDMVWRMAGAPSRRAFEATSGPVLHKFETTSDGRYLFNRRLLKEYAVRNLEREAKVRGGRTRLQDSSRSPQGLHPQPQSATRTRTRTRTK